MMHEQLWTTRNQDAVSSMYMHAMSTEWRLHVEPGTFVLSISKHNKPGCSMASYLIYPAFTNLQTDYAATMSSLSIEKQSGSQLRS